MSDGLSCRFRQLSIVALNTRKQPDTGSAYATTDGTDALGALMTGCFSGLSFEH